MPRHDAAPVCPCPHRDDRPRRAADGLRVCRSCRDRMEQAIAESPALYDALQAALVAADGRSSDPVTHRKDPGLVLSEAALRARSSLRSLLVATIRMVIDERGLTRWPADEVPHMSTWLLAHVDWLAAHPAAEDFVAEWTAARTEARRAAYPSGTRRIELECCPDCSGELIAWLRPADDLLPSVICCDGPEEHTWEPHEWQALGRRLVNGLGGLSA